MSKNQENQLLGTTEKVTKATYVSAIGHIVISPWDFPSKNTAVSCHFLLEIFLTQGSNMHLLQWQVNSLLLSIMPSKKSESVSCSALSYSL